MAPDQQPVHPVPLDEIEVSPENVRKTRLKQGIEELASSIEKFGLLQPVVLRGHFGGHRPYELLVGQRRFMAHQWLRDRGRLADARIKAIFIGDIDDTEARIWSLTENLARVGLSRADTLAAVGALYEELGSIETVAARTGLSQIAVKKNLHVREFATPRMLQLLDERAVTLDQIKRALKAARYNIGKAEELLDCVVEYSLNTHQQVRMAQHGDQHPEATVDDLRRVAEEPRYDERLILSLRGDVRVALDEAAQEHEMTAEDLAAQVVQEWLVGEGRVDAE